jgi:hypothetical protein
MRGFAILALMVMMILLVSPMTAMAHGGMGNTPILAVTMATWSDIVTAKQGIEQPGPHEGKISVRYSYGISLTHATIMSARVAEGNVSDISETARATIGKVGGVAILASGQPRFSPSYSTVI